MTSFRWLLGYLAGIQDPLSREVTIHIHTLEQVFGEDKIRVYTRNRNAFAQLLCTHLT